MRVLFFDLLVDRIVDVCLWYSSAGVKLDPGSMNRWQRKDFTLRSNEISATRQARLFGKLD